jgi:DNA-binding NarL/FixJ family response regulator
VRVLIGEDEALLREGLVLMLSRAGFAVVGQTGDASELPGLSAELHPDVVVTDIRMPPTHSDDGLRAALEIRGTQPGTAVMLTSQYVQRRYAMELMGEDPGGVGYLLKQRITDGAAFCHDLRTVAGGGTVLDPEVVRTMMDRATRQTGALTGLTPRQRQVLSAMAEGHSNAAIARALGITERAVVQHASAIYDQFGLPVSQDSHRRVLAVLRHLAADDPGP